MKLLNILCTKLTYFEQWLKLVKRGEIMHFPLSPPLSSPSPSCSCFCSLSSSCSLPWWNPLAPWDHRDLLSFLRWSKVRPYYSIALCALNVIDGVKTDFYDDFTEQVILTYYGRVHGSVFRWSQETAGNAKNREDAERRSTSSQQLILRIVTPVNNSFIISSSFMSKTCIPVNSFCCDLY